VRCKPLPNLLNFERPRPKIKPKSTTQLTLLPEPQPPTEHREPVPIARGGITRKISNLRGGLPLHLAIDYDKLTPTEQARWDAGMWGSIQLKNDRGNEYYVTRWVDPNTGVKRSNRLGRTYKEAIDKLRLLTHPP
jgi:hypothetical protein